MGNLGAEQLMVMQQSHSKLGRPIIIEDKMKYYKFIIVFVILTTISKHLYAGGGDFLSLKNSKTLSLNGLYLAGVDGVLGIRINPASLSHLSGYGFEITALDKLGDQTINTNNNGKYVSFRNDDFNIAFGGFAKLLDNLSIGISYSPELRYNVDWPYTQLNTSESASIVSAYDLRNSISIDAISPILSYRMGNLSLGISANIYHATLDYSYPTTNTLWADGTGLPGYELNYKLEGWSFGFTAGMQYSFSNYFSIALAIQSSSQIDIKGDLKSNLFKELYELPTDAKVKTKWEIPWKISLGGMYKLNPKLAINLDASMHLYTRPDELLIHEYENSALDDALSPSHSVVGLSGSGVKTNLKNLFNAGIGLEYVPSSTLSYRISYLYNQSSQEESMYSHLFSNIDQHWFAAGIGINQSKFLIDLTLSYALGVNTSIDSKSAVIEGKYDSQLFIPSITVKYIL